VGVVLPEEDALAKQVTSMMSSLESVKSLCDFSYMEKEESEKALAKGEIFAVLRVPEGLVQGIMDGSNIPIEVVLPKNGGVESRIFRELTEAGAAILSSAQAGIYAGDELLLTQGLSESVPQLEEELNKIYLGYSLPRMDYFRQLKVSAAGDVDVFTFYGISMAVFSLFLCAIPVSGFLVPHSRVMKKKLLLLGVGRGTVIGARILGLTLLFLVPGMAALLAALAVGRVSWQPLTLPVLALVCLAAASVIVLCYQAAGSLMGGLMLLFLGATATHFLAGGFLPLVFLPSNIRRAAPFMPSYLLMEGVKMMVTAEWNPVIFGKLLLLFAGAFLISALLEGKET
jgi:ABC-2 type transport system permease protein